MKKHIGKIVIVAAALLIVGSFMIADRAADKANEGVTIETRVKGNPDSEVVLTEYSDFQCPACGQFHPVIQDIVDQYGDNLRLEYKHFPLITIHPYAVPAARAAEAAAQQGKFFEMHDLLFENQEAWSRASTPESFFIQYAEDLELDVATFKRHMDSSVINDSISNSFKDAQAQGLTSTPTFFLNGERMSFETFDDFIGQIEAAVNGTSVEAEVSETEDSGIQFGI